MKRLYPNVGRLYQARWLLREPVSDPLAFMSSASGLYHLSSLSAVTHGTCQSFGAYVDLGYIGLMRPEKAFAQQWCALRRCLTE